METAIKELENFIGSWNGKDDSFMHEGSIYHEDDINTAQEALTILKEQDE